MTEKTAPSQKTRKAGAESKTEKGKPKEKATVTAPKAKPSAKPKAKPTTEPVAKAKTEVKAKAAAKPKAKPASKVKAKAQAKAKPKARRPLPTKPKAPTAPEVPAARQPVRQEVASGILISYQRGALRPRLQYGLIRLTGITTEGQAAAFVGRTAILRINERVSVSGRVIGPHGGNGVLRVRFHRGIAPDALTKEVKLF